MKVAMVLSFGFIFSNSNVWAGSCLSDSDAIIFPPLAYTSAPTSCLSHTTESTVEGENRKAMLIEAAPLAANFLTTGQGLDNPALVYAMHIVSVEGQKDQPEELAIRIIEQANR